MMLSPPGMGAHVVHRAREIVGVAVRAVHGARRIQVQPAAGDFDRWFANFQELQHARGRPADAVAKRVQLLPPDIRVIDPGLLSRYRHRTHRARVSPDRRSPRSVIQRSSAARILRSRMLGSLYGRIRDNASHRSSRFPRRQVGATVFASAQTLALKRVQSRIGPRKHVHSRTLDCTKKVSPGGLSSICGRPAFR